MREKIEFYILKQDYEYYRNGGASAVITEHTSVKAYTAWVLDCIQRIGKVIVLDAGKTVEAELRRVLGKPNAILVASLTGWDARIDAIPHRKLRLSFGNLLFFEGFKFTRGRNFPLLNIVSTQFQIDRLKFYLGDSSPQMCVFPPKVDGGYFVPPDAAQRIRAKKKEGIPEGKTHIVYAGRWISTKGLCQIIRMFDIWPLPNAVVTLVGNFERTFSFANSNATHELFPRFFENEILQHKARPWLRLKPAMGRDELRELFWSADLFINPSVQPDENYGLTPREALCCGVPVVTTNFCGLHPLAAMMPWKGVDTYPTHFGSRFSIRQFRNTIQKAADRISLKAPQQWRNWIMEEFNQEKAIEDLKCNVEKLVTLKPRVFDTSQHPENKVIKKLLIASAPMRRIAGYYKLNKNNSIEAPEGAYVYGDKPFGYSFPFVQGIYSALPGPPRVRRNSTWRGFFRVVLWEKEKTVVEFGFPGPRTRRYTAAVWKILKHCAHDLNASENTFAPATQKEVKVIQELVDLGYVCSDSG